MIASPLLGVAARGQAASLHPAPARERAVSPSSHEDGSSKGKHGQDDPEPEKDRGGGRGQGAAGRLAATAGASSGPAATPQAPVASQASPPGHAFGHDIHDGPSTAPVPFLATPEPVTVAPQRGTAASPSDPSAAAASAAGAGPAVRAA